MTEIHVAASQGHPYTVTRDDRGIIRLQRQTVAGHIITVVFGPAEAYAVADALVDLAERTK